jgi:putative ABC transport system ATP-binding protein
MKSTPLVQIGNLSRVYPQGDKPVHALSNIGLQIDAGEFTALMGPSGSGKTTLLNLIGALDKPDSGSIRIGSDHLEKLTRAQLATLRLRKIGFVFQDYNLIPVLSALENVEYVLVLQKVPAAERRKRAEQALRAVGLGDHLQRRPAQLSGGQQQRVAVARAIVGNPLLVLADEPTANLDSETGEALLQMMLRLNVEQGITFVFSTHDELVMRHARRIVKMKDGAIAEDTVSCAS